ncbi:hypothetical protein [Reichenbachiella sp.]|uniref:hypothetical protein n=1 Tax=Reichenbachiella sp. TaxID=2184521 RepID=UPI003BAE2E57
MTNTVKKIEATRQIHFFVLLFLGTFCQAFSQSQSVLQEKISIRYLEKANELKFQNSDSSILLFKLSYNENMQNGDTLAAIQSLVDLSDLYAHNANFGLAYDGYWEALSLADHIDHSGARASVFTGLGWLYSLYRRDDDAIKYFTQSIKINKVRIKEMNLNKQILLADYYAMATLFRKNRQFITARLYLDSCRLVQNINERLEDSNAFISAELGYVLHGEKKHKEALATLLPLENYFVKNRHDYLVIYHSFLGKIYHDMGNLKLAERYFQSAVEASKIHKSHLDLVPEIYESFSHLLVEKGDMKNAYDMLLEAKTLNESQFGSRSDNNRFILEIKDEFRIEKEEQQKILQEEKLARLEQEDKIWYLQSLILYGTIIFLIILIFVVYRYFRTRYKAEKRLLKEKQRLELQKTREVLEVKNKELTASALQVIQRDEVLTDLKNQINEQKNNPDTKKLTKLAKSIDISSSNNWKEFETRFVSVNKSFYNKLNQEYPSLSQGDQKICALIKLNFTSKDMAKLLGISIESVHTTRYRLRKKLNLERSDNLEDFIGKFE